MLSTQPQLRIAIVGAGLAGLSLARTLQQNDISCTVYELDSSPDSRPQGGSLDLHTETGQLALRNNGLWDTILPHMRYEGQDLRILDKTGKVWYDEIVGPERDERPEVDRGILRQTYLDSLKDGTIHWETRIKEIISENDKEVTADPQQRSRFKLVFAHGEEETFDVVVGADGAWSRIRAFLSDVKPTYTGITFFETALLNVDQEFPEESKLVGRGTATILSDMKGLLLQRNGDGSVRNYIALRIPEDHYSPKQVSDESFVRQRLFEQFSDWSDDLKAIVTKGQGLIHRKINTLPPDHRWTSRPGVTIIGDAAHLMSPFAGEGANLAMIDGVDLGDAIVKVVKQGADLAIVQEEFEKSMMARSQRASEMSASNLEMFFSDDAAYKLTAFFEQHMNHEA
ncbi:hypothetical protein EC973_000473 [Apophysomyces ossiformis]|uniref:FAD-binding domain-containing protein n=1 Tax=Apophysomyces ossiformis TaxID=679940 RepID=A0A8H7BLL3_9FUNG|nr:hypothetical protein EC973_000473 [Apophysomyces ossiformis]